VDDACPEASGQYIRSICNDPRVYVLSHAYNQGVGGAVITGWMRATEDAMDVVVKLDGDGQMDPDLIPRFVAPILLGQADYTKGNRFYNMRDVLAMPRLRIFGNWVLSFFTKASTGYWDVFDPTNGYVAIHTSVVRLLPVNCLSRRYFFESDLLFRLGTVRARVMDIPMKARYEGEESHLKISHIVLPFLWGHARNGFKRLVYAYFIRDFHIASLELLLGLGFLAFGLGFGMWQWATSILTGATASPGTVMLAALPVLLGTQLVLAFLNFDIRMVPRQPMHPNFKVTPLFWPSTPGCDGRAPSPLPDLSAPPPGTTTYPPC
jgi:glycosyltransferase involved in cell wall biosynthesis